MSKKKQQNIERNVQKKAETKALKTRLENFMVMAVSVILVYAVVFLIFNNYINSSLSGGMQVLRQILIWASIAGTALFAVLGAVKKDTRYYKWSLFCMANVFLWFIFNRFSGLYLLPKARFLISGIAYCFYALLIALIFSIVYYFLALSRSWEKKSTRTVYFVVLGIVLLLFVVSALVFMYLNGNITGTMPPIK